MFYIKALSADIHQSKTTLTFIRVKNVTKGASGQSILSPLHSAI